MNMTVPQMVMLSANHDLNEKWSILGNVGWQNWSRFGMVEIGVNSINPQTLTVDGDYKDTGMRPWGPSIVTRGNGHSPAASLTTAPPLMTTNDLSLSPWGRHGDSPRAPSMH
jgi:hypothetical protein